MEMQSVCESWETQETFPITVLNNQEWNKNQSTVQSKYQ